MPVEQELSARVNEVIAKTTDYFARLDGRSPGASAVTRRVYARSARATARRIANVGVALAVLIAATIAFGLIVGPIGLNGLFVVMALAVLALLFFSVWPGERPLAPFRDDMTNTMVVQRLEGLLVRHRAALPAAAAQKVDAIGAQLPLLESRLGQLNALDPLAQDARRLMGQHLPDLIERYERVPAQYRSQADAGGLTVDQRLAAGLDAARTAIDDIGRKLAEQDLNAFETQGRFIEARYREDPALEAPDAPVLQAPPAPPSPPSG